MGEKIDREREKGDEQRRRYIDRDRDRERKKNLQVGADLKVEKVETVNERVLENQVAREREIHTHNRQKTHTIRKGKTTNNLR